MTNTSELEKGVDEPEVSSIPSDVKIVSKVVEMAIWTRETDFDRGVMGLPFRSSQSSQLVSKSEMGHRDPDESRWSRDTHVGRHVSPRARSHRS
jgi:hypothetical protein